MELGYFTMPLHPPGSDITKTLEDDLEQIVTLDELGYKEAGIGEHFTFAWEIIPCPEVLSFQRFQKFQCDILGQSETPFQSRNALGGV